MDSLVGYGSDDEVEERHGSHHHASGGGGYHSGHGGGTGGGSRRREDDTNYDDVNMDMSEDSQGGESEPELPQAESAPSKHYRDDQKNNVNSRDRRPERRRRETPPRPRQRLDREKDRRSPKRDDRYRAQKSDRSRGGSSSRDGSRRGLLGDRPEQIESKPPALMDLKPFGGELPPALEQRKSHDARDAVSPRFSERDRPRERDRERERRTSRHSEEKRSSHKYGSDVRERSRSRGAPAAASASHSSSSSSDRRSPPDYRPSYKVNKKLEVMEKMGLQIKTPDGSMATAQQLRAAAAEPAHAAHPAGAGAYFNPGAVSSHRILDQVQKRKLLWSNKAKNETEEAAKWSGTRFAQDNDGKQVSKFMRLMGIKEPAAVNPEPIEETADPIKKQEELFQAMQAQYEVARATTHTMRGVGLGFQRGQY